MKKHMFKKLIILLFIALLQTLTSAPAEAQEIAYTPSIPEDTASLVRQLNEDVSIFYVKKNHRHGFLFYNRLSPTTAILADFPMIYDLHDFEVFRDTVFFCGTQTGSTPKGVVGFISVNDLFFNNGSYVFGIIDGLFFVPTVPNPAYLSSGDRMDMFIDQNGIAHFALVGRLEQSAIYGQDSRLTICDVWYDHDLNDPHWWGSVLYQKGDRYQPVDITCTRNYVVASALNKATQYPELVIFHKIVNFPTAPLMNNTVQIKLPLASSGVLVERLEQDRIAVAQHFKYDSIAGTAIHYIDDVSQLTTLSSYNYTIMYNHYFNDVQKWLLRDLRYNQTKLRLLLLHDTQIPSWPYPMPIVFDYNFVTLIHKRWRHLSQEKMFSLDNREMHHCSTSGIHVNYPLLSIVKDEYERCFRSTSFTCETIFPVYSFGQYDEAALFLNKKPESPTYPYPLQIGVTNECGSFDDSMIFKEE